MSLTLPMMMTLVPASQYCGEFVELLDEQIAVGGRLDDDHVGRRRVAIGLHRRRGAAHVLLDMGLAHAAVADGGLDDGGGFRRFAESLDRNARDRVDLRDRRRRLGVDGRGVLPSSCVRIDQPPPTWPIGVTSVFQSVPGSVPWRTFSIARRRITSSGGVEARACTRSRGSSICEASADCVAQPKFG